MRKIFVLLCVSLIALCIGIPALADGEATITFETNEYGGNRKCTYTYPDGGVLYFGEDLLADGELSPYWILYESEGLQGDVVVPGYLDGKPVERLFYHNPPTSDDSHYFCLAQNPDLVSVTFPSTLKGLGRSETWLTAVGGEGWFDGCGKLEEILFTGDGPEVLTPRFFKGAANLKHIKLPKNVAELDGAFAYVEPWEAESTAYASLTSLELDAENEHFVMDSQGILYNADSTRVITAIQGAAERKSATLPETVTGIADYAFTGNRKLEKIYGGAANIMESPHAFDGCANLNPLQDIYGHWAEEYVKDVFQAGLLKGTSLTRFTPDMALERGMVSTILYRLAGGYTSSTESPFPDVQYYDYFGPGTIWAKENGLVQGYDDGLFHPADPVTREQLAAFLYRYAQLQGIGEKSASLDSFPDGDSTSEYARTAMEWAVGSGLLQGCGDGRLAPRGTATRAEAAAILQRVQSLG